jgi:UrcA family protein
MTTGTQLHRYSVRRHTPIRAAAFVALFALASAAIADQSAEPAPVTRVAKVSLADLDLSTPQGAHAAHDRLRIAAEHLCFQLADPRKIDFRAVYDFCVAETLADAVRRIHAPALAALEK